MSEVTSSVTLVTLIVSALALAYNLFVLHTVTRLEKMGCECAMDWRRTFISDFTIFMVVWIATTAIVGMVWPRLLSNVAFATVSGVVGLVAFVNAVISLQYIADLRKDKCKCSESVARTVWEVLLWLYVAAIAIMVFKLIIFVVLSSWVASKSKRR